MLRNDNSVTFGYAVDDFATRYNDGQRYDRDHIFSDENPDGNFPRDNARLSHFNQTATLSPF